MTIIVSSGSKAHGSYVWFALVHTFIQDGVLKRVLLTHATYIIGPQFTYNIPLFLRRFRKNKETNETISVTNENETQNL